MAYYEGDGLPMNMGGNGFSDGWWGIILIALLFGWGRGNGFGSNGGGGNEMVGYELGKMATQSDIASGFANNSIVGSLNDIRLNQAGINTSILTSQSGLSAQIADCCCKTQNALLENRYITEKQTCEIITNANANTQRILDYLQTEKINSLTAENVTLKGRISNNEQTAYIINSLRPIPSPAYVVPNPFTPPTTTTTS